MKSNSLLITKLINWGRHCRFNGWEANSEQYNNQHQQSWHHEQPGTNMQ